MAPRDCRNATGNPQAEGCAASTFIVSGKVASPKVSKAIETSSAMRSSGLRQKIRTAIVPYAAAKTMSTVTAYTA
jgi:citrate lyase synthetase